MKNIEISYLISNLLREPHRNHTNENDHTNHFEMQQKCRKTVILYLNGNAINGGRCM
jgi:hypothetical protein